MNKYNRKTKVIITLICALVLVLGIFLALGISHSRNCKDIIGDGYAMGTDPKPVVIGNTCDQ